MEDVILQFGFSCPDLRVKICVMSTFKTSFKTFRDYRKK